MKPGMYRSVYDEHRVDTNFIQWSQHQIRDMTLDHIGFGDFQLVGNGSRVVFSRLGAADYPGGVGRDHKMAGDPTAIGILIGMWRASQVPASLHQSLYWREQE